MSGMEKIRVLHCISGLKIGGANQVLLDTIGGLDRSRFQSFVCHVTAKDTLRGDYMALEVEPVGLGHSGRFQTFRSMHRLRALIHRVRPHVVHTNLELDGNLARVVGRLTGCRVVSTLHNTNLARQQLRSEPLYWKRRTQEVLENVTARLFVDHFVAVSDAVREVYTKHRGVPAGKTTVIHSGIDLERFRPSESAVLEALRASLDITAETRVLLTVGRLNEQKGQKYLVPTMETLARVRSDVVLLIAGDGEEKDALDRAIRAAGLESRIRLLGARRDIPRLLEIADLFVFPSIHREGFPISVLEAMAAGKPIVASSIPGVTDLLRDGEIGVLVPPRDPAALAAALDALLNDPRRAEEIAEAGRHTVRRQYTREASAARVGAIYEHLVSREPIEGARLSPSLA
jgi:glycosyltransferase involved in cell wall biosynthesis